jgi:hypothetical protein
MVPVIREIKVEMRTGITAGEGANDRGGDRDFGSREHPLGADKYVEKLNDMSRDFGDWIREHGYGDLATGNRDKSDDRENRGTEYHLLDPSQSRSPYSLGIDTSRLTERTEYLEIEAFAYGHGFTVTSGLGHRWT